MPLPTTEAQEYNLTARVARPVYIVRHAHSGVDELVSCSGKIVYDGQLYEEGGCNMRSIEDSRSASFTLPATIERKQQVQNGTWRDGRCTIYHIPGAPKDGGTYSLEDGFIILEGKIQTSAYNNGVISVTATHTNNLNKISPRHTWDEVCPHIPATGTELSWEGDRLILSARTFSGRGSAGANPALAARGRLSAQQLKGLSQPTENLTLTTTGAGAPIPIIYGERPAPGSVIAVGSISGDLVLAIGWGYGEVQSVEDVYINGEVVPGGVTVTHYLGGTGQGVDPTLAAAIPAFNSDMILRTPEGVIGCFYSVFRIPSGQLSAAPTFMIVPKGKAIFDPRIVGANDPHRDSTQFEVVFDGQDGSTTATDKSQNNHPINFYYDAQIQNGLLYFNGEPALKPEIQIPDHPSLELGGADFSIEIKEKPEGLVGGFNLLDKFTTVGDQRSVLIRRDDDQILLYLSSTGTAWDIVVGRVVATLTTDNEYTLSVNRSGSDFQIFINGKLVDSFTNANPIFNSGRYIKLFPQDFGSGAATTSVRSIRITIGGCRYLDSDHPASGVPFSNYATYSDNTALCMGDFAANPIYGMGATVRGLEESADWNDSLLDDTIPRCRLAMVLTDPRRTVEYLDLFADYAECFWFNEGAAIRIKPDKIIDADSPCGQLVNTNSEFLDDSAWVQSGDNKWVLGGGGAAINGSQSAANSLHQNLTLTDGVDYVITMVVDSTSAGTVSPYLNGPISGEEYVEPGTYGVKVAGTGASVSIGVVASSDFIGTLVSVKINRLYWHETNFVKGSLSIHGLDDSDAPTSVSTRFTVPSGTSPNWQQSLTQPIRLPGVAEGEIPNVETTLHLQGITRLAEANSKANARLQRYRNRTRYQWITRNHGVRFRKGDVIELDLENHGINERVRHEYSRLTKCGFHEVTASRYDEKHYPSELILPDGTGLVPLGAIVLLSGSEVPDGWDNYTAANGSYIVGAGGDFSPGDTGGSNSFSGWNGISGTAGMHDTGIGYGNGTQFQAPDFFSGPYWRSSSNPDESTLQHNHSYSTGVVNVDLSRRENRLIIKTGTASVNFPPEAQVFGLEGLLAPEITRLTSSAGRLIKAAAASANAGQSSQTLTFNLEEAGPDAHSHYTVVETVLATGDLVQPQSVRAYFGAGGPHEHYVGPIPLNRDIKRRLVPLYGGSTEFAVIPGMMILWSGDPFSLPTDWVLCDGANGTYDLRDFFIEISPLNMGGGQDGDNTISFGGDSEYHYHSHFTGDTGYSTQKRQILAHQEPSGHRHSVGPHSASFVPLYYALAMIMYSPS